MWGAREGGVVAAGLLAIVNALENLQDEPQHAFVFCDGDEFARVDTICTEKVTDFVSEAVHQMVDLGLTLPKALVVDHKAVDEVVNGDEVVEVEVSLQEVNGLVMHFAGHLDRIVFGQLNSSDDGRVLPSGGFA